MYWRWRSYSLFQANILLETKVKERTLQLKNILQQKETLLNEKDVLLKEIHHRVKNNLQVVSGLLELQSKSTSNEDSKNALLEGRNRVAGMALIHQNLYQNENLGNVDIKKFVTDLHKQVESIFHSARVSVQLETDIEPLIIDLDTIVPLGLILNELFTNSFKYAFVDMGAGKIIVMMRQVSQGHYALTYCDNGHGLPVDFNIEKAASLGMMLVRDLSRQVGGDVRYNKRENCFTIAFTNKSVRKLVD
jgi:two-component sensor histidine kinase